MENESKTASENAIDGAGTGRVHPAAARDIAIAEFFCELAKLAKACLPLLEAVAKDELRRER